VDCLSEMTIEQGREPRGGGLTAWGNGVNVFGARYLANMVHNGFHSFSVIT